MGSLQQICLRWNNHQSNFPKVFDELLQSKDLVDVTLTCDGRTVDAHKVVLSACSPYFRKLFQNNPCKHPIVFMRDVKYSELEAIVEFMYKGEVNVARDELTDFLRTAQSLQIKGLAEEKNVSEKSESAAAPKAQQSVPATVPRPALPALTPVQPIQNNTSNNSNSLLQASTAKKIRLMPSNNSPSVSSSSNSKLSVTPHSTPPRLDSVGSQSPQRQPARKVEGSNDHAAERQFKVEMSNEEDMDDDESRDEMSGEDQQGLDMLMESTLETGDDSYVVGESGDGNMFPHGMDKSSVDSPSDLSQHGASTSGLSNQLLQTEGLRFLHPAHQQLLLEDFGPDHPRGNLWSNEETETLLDVWRHPSIQTKMNYVRNSVAYDAMAQMMQERGFDRNSAQCKNKVKNLKFLYSRYKQTGLMAHGATPSHDNLRVFHIMNCFMGSTPPEREKNRPVSLQMLLPKQEKDGL